MTELFQLHLPGYLSASACSKVFRNKSNISLADICVVRMTQIKLKTFLPNKYIRVLIHFNIVRCPLV